MGDCKNSQVVFLLFGRSESCRMQLRVNLQYRLKKFEKVQQNVTQCQPGR